MSVALVIHVKKKYFDQIKSGRKKRNTEKVSPYWIPRIMWKCNSLYNIVIVCGYASWKKEPDMALIFPWKGYEIKTITHEEFGKEPVEVFALKLERDFP